MALLERRQVLAAGLAATWLAALSPPVFYDALVYHLALPNLWLLRGRMEHLPGVVYSVFPQAAEVLGSGLDQILEIGAGSGALAASLLEELERQGRLDPILRGEA